MQVLVSFLFWDKEAEGVGLPSGLICCSVIWMKDFLVQALPFAPWTQKQDTELGGDWVWSQGYSYAGTSKAIFPSNLSSNKKRAQISL